MTQNELLIKLKELEIDFENKKVELMKEYVRANNPYKIGDIITDHIGSIVIEKIGYYICSNPCASYYGLELKKDGTPKKAGTKRSAYQSNLIK